MFCVFGFLLGARVLGLVGAAGIPHLKEWKYGVITVKGVIFQALRGMLALGRWQSLRE
jgi:hypothetical protein